MAQASIHLACLVDPGTLLHMTRHSTEDTRLTSISTSMVTQQSPSQSPTLQSILQQTMHTSQLSIIQAVVATAIIGSDTSLTSTLSKEEPVATEAISIWSPLRKVAQH